MEMRDSGVEKAEAPKQVATSLDGTRKVESILVPLLRPRCVLVRPQFFFVSLYFPNSVYASRGSNCLELDRFVDRVYATFFDFL